MNNQVKLLLVDDEPDILEFLSYNFRKNGFNVVTASNGLEGIKRMNAESPQVVISDILMPEMDGIEMCKVIRKSEEFYKVPFIFLTAVTDDYKVLYAMSSGADQFVSKPNKFEYLLGIVNHVMLEKNTPSAYQK